MDLSIFEELYAQAIGREALKYLSGADVREAAAQEARSAALQVLTEIKTILDDDTLDDPACFRRIDAIVDAFHKSGISTIRHDF